MATLKVLIVTNEAKKETKVIIQKKKFDDYQKFQELKDEIIGQCKKKGFENILSTKHNFILRYIKDEKSNAYFPDDLNNMIFNNATMDYLKEKLSLREIKGELYKFQIEKVDKMPKWKRKEYHKLLESALEKQWKPICDEIKREVGLDELEKSQDEYNKKKNELIENEKKINKEHTNIICNNCFKKNIKGKRFVCAECFNYNLCQNCEKIYYKRQIHDRKHVLIQVNKPLLGDENNILKYDNIISNNNQEIKIDSSDIEESKVFPFGIEIANSGENNLEDCYILPVRYGEDYLRCEKVKINESIERNYSEKIKMMIILPNSDKKYYEGYFRMFTPSGLPFGQVIFIKVFIYE